MIDPPSTETSPPQTDTAGVGGPDRKSSPSGKDRPRIYIDGLNLALESGTGVATYARNLSAALAGLGAEVGIVYGRSTVGREGLLQEISFFDPVEDRGPRPVRWMRAASAVLRATSGVRATEIVLSGAVISDNTSLRPPDCQHVFNHRRLFRLANDYFKVHRRLLKLRCPRPPDIMHWTYPIPIEMVGARNIYTIHDLVPLRLPQTTLDQKATYLRLARLLSERADHLVTVSESSKRDIMEILRVPAHRITNTYQAVEIPETVRNRSVGDVVSTVEGIFGLPYQGYYLFFGAIEPKKNIDRLIQAYLGSNVRTPLVILGKKAWLAEKELRLLDIDRFRTSQRWRPNDDRSEFSDISRQSLGDQHNVSSEPGSKVIYLQYAPFSLLMSLVRGARGVLFPSLYEGFGLPVLEAMNLGTPVVTSNISSLPEIAGEAALTVNPYDTEAIMRAIRMLDGDEDLREELSRRGLQQAKLFSHDVYSSRLRELYSALGAPL